MASGLEQARFKGMLEALQVQDPDITRIVAHSKFVVAYLLQQDGTNPGWRKANIEGPVYIVHRQTVPRYQLLVKNQLHMNDLLDTLHPDWELDCQQNYVFYKVQDATQRIRGLWFHDDTQRQKIESMLESTLQEMRNSPAEAQMEPMPVAPEPKAPVSQPEPPVQVQVPVAQPEPLPQSAPMPGRDMPAQVVDQLYSQFGLASPVESAAHDSVTITMSSLRSALHALADDDNFCEHVMQKLKNSQAHS
uniref:mRNA-decapping enzyme C-terminal domain-containing protein n=1 Tax=Alexandrium catenella TaxID=2925 RepID=A0A7S1RRI0_ALECA|mmetsp:Transcript_70287/g.186787  ORF Transcript_70287/g.186787 Transcript_70287/m.186787 type:complete len:248 (+) Transcript_70287:59-802(+)|eukprot:CAMPEP_0171205074 /NCGR_PEP_ID=MMETSP0790-20130122/26365_1 /TAXON_ID=2925 /ORGANISM="Alexandrium catenella, Strain OF101" /LENGTH=247 /DNA_ID=CAMNT_0011670587 /DNA_START=51 /DNA_END=794 /DNA_ORIENTATION=+